METSDSTDSEEEILIYAEFDENVEIGSYRSIHGLGVDSKNPIIQMDDTFFTGKYETPNGTFMFFEPDLSPLPEDHIFERVPENRLKYICKTRKFLNMSHAYVTPKEGTAKDTKSNLGMIDDDVQVVTFNSIQEAIEKFKCDWTPTDDLEVKSSEENIENSNRDESRTTKMNLEDSMEIEQVT
ncbi:hypothetical protein JYU34_010968 [Plutella xylostella]|uniref:Transcription factor TFIIIC triple barrel domain-containing protein n=1 Tax=Plutella xylostella TaxID=51655 RepID=A0ABQ7QFT1_PLUXY|nr:hypothetical protein JYU34_010968 [Plutella xylostella]